jgi:hypothetical protein
VPNSIASKCRNYALLAVAVAGIVIIAVSLIAGIGLRPAHAKGSPTSPDFKAQTLALAKPEQRPAVSPPLAFEENQGQTDPQVNYLARGNGFTLFLTGSDAVFSIHSKTPRDRRLTGRHVRARNTMELSESHAAATAMVRMHLVDANSSARVMAQTPLSAKSNYYLGNDPRNWRTNVSNYATVSYAGVYPGIDLAYHGRQHDLEFDFMVEPEANPALIRLAFNGAAGIATDDSGNLEVGSGSEKLVFHKPFAYQQANGSRQIVDARFVIQADKVGFRLGRYDHSRELVIDPTVTFATFMGGSAEDDAYGVNFDLFGNVYITGQTASTNFPASGGLASTNQGEFDAFVTKLSADGSTVVYSTYVGGSGNDSGNAIAVDAAGDAFVAGGTSSSNFPSNGGFQAASAGGLDAFVLELAASGGSLIYSSYLGGGSDDVANGIAIDGSGNAYVAGSTQSSNFPTTSNVIQGSLNGGNNAFVAKLNSSGSALSYSTFLGGSATDLATAVAIDSAGDAYVTGETDSPDFPVSSGAFQPQCGTDGNCNGGLTDAFVAVLNPSASAFLYSTFLGGADDDQGLGIAVDSSGDAYVAGFTRSNSSFPLQ